MGHLGRKDSLEEVQGDIGGQGTGGWIRGESAWRAELNQLRACPLYQKTWRGGSWWRKPLIPALGRQRQVTDCEFGTRSSRKPGEKSKKGRNMTEFIVLSLRSIMGTRLKSS